MILAIRLLLLLFLRLLASRISASPLVYSITIIEIRTFSSYARPAGPRALFSINARLISLAGWIIARGEKHGIGPPEDDRYVVGRSLARARSDLRLSGSATCCLNLALNPARFLSTTAVKVTFFRLHFSQSPKILWIKRRTLSKVI
jgi:hypothetical protein